MKEHVKIQLEKFIRIRNAIEKDPIWYEYIDDDAALVEALDYAIEHIKGRNK